MSEEIKDEILEFDEDQTEEYLEVPEKLPPIMINLDDYDLEQFKQGIEETSYMAGVITALLNTGVSEDFVLNFILNRETVAHNIEMAKINQATSIEVSKNTKAQVEKYEL